MTEEQRIVRVEQKRLRKERKKKEYEEYVEKREELERVSEEKKIQSFSESIKNTTDLLTCFGIFNALVIYSNSMQITMAADFLSFLFNVISLIILYEAYKYYDENSEESFQMLVFKSALFLIQFVMVVSVFINYPNGAQVTISLALTWLGMTLIGRLLTFVPLKILKFFRDSDFLWKIMLVGAVFALFFLSFVHVSPYLYHFFFEGGLEKNWGVKHYNAIPFNDTPKKSIYQIMDMIQTKDSLSKK